MIRFSSKRITNYLLVLLGCSVPFGPVFANENVVYSYDVLGRLTSTSIAGGPNTGTTVGATFDPAGNRSGYTVSGNSGGGPAPGCNFAIDDADGNDEFTTYVVVRKTGTCSGEYIVSYNTDEGSPNGTLRFTDDNANLTISIPPACCAVGVIFYYNIRISIAAGVAGIADGNAVVRVYGNG